MAEETSMPVEQQSPSLKDKLSSRKFIVTMLGIAVNVFMYTKGSLSADVAMNNVMYIIGIFVAGEALVDSSRQGGSAIGALLGTVTSNSNNDQKKPSVTEIISVVSDVMNLVKKNKDGEAK